MKSSAEPRFATPRSPERESFGWRIAKIAEKMGTPLMPWQRMVADVGTEVDPETGLPAYREVVVTVPRQSGKTTLILAVEYDRSISWPRPQHVAYTAQTGLDARAKLVKDQMPLLERSPLRAGISGMLKGASYTAIEFVNGSRIEALATSEDAGHGKTIGLGVIDEAMADEDDRREQALLPAMLTIQDAQLWIPSTAGTDKSVFLRRKVDTGRHAVVAGQRSGIAYFEWSADEDADPDDPATWWSCMPALGFTQTEAAVEHARQSMSDGEFRRAMLNQWTSSEERLIPEVVWRSVVSSSAAVKGTPWFGVDSQPSRESAVIVVADDSGSVEVVERRPGVSWLRSRLAELTENNGGTVVVDSGGPLGGLEGDLRRAGVPVVAYSTQDMKHACARIYDMIADRELRVRPDTFLDQAVAGVSQRQVGDAWLWGRSKSTVDISPLVAMTLAVDAASAQEETGPPVLSFV